MKATHPKFVPVKPHGNIGDLKNDGYDPESGVYTCVYSPEDIQERSTISRAAKKVKADIDGLVSNWKVGVREIWFFVNDRERGLPAPVALAFETARAKHSGIIIRIVLSPDLIEMLARLGVPQIESVLGVTVPSAEDIPTIDLREFRVLVQHILNNSQVATHDGLLRAPNLSEKISINGLSVGIGSMLQNSSRQHGLIDQYFREAGSYERQRVRNILAGWYSEALGQFRESSVPESAKADSVFWKLLHQIVPSHGTAGGGASQLVQDAGVAIIAYYFESCDIFEAPK